MGHTKKCFWNLAWAKDLSGSPPSLISLTGHMFGMRKLTSITNLLITFEFVYSNNNLAKHLKVIRVTAPSSIIALIAS